MGHNETKSVGPTGRPSSFISKIDGRLIVDMASCSHRFRGVAQKPSQSTSFLKELFDFCPVK